MAGDTMRAAVVEAPGAMRIVRAPLPQTRAGEVRVRIVGSGVCGGDLAVWEGRPWFDYPRAPGAPGHEAWGAVEALGDGVRAFEVGDRVTGLFDAAYAEAQTLPADRLLRVPPELATWNVPGEPLACAMNAFRRSDIRARHRVAIVGAGFIGGLIGGLAARAGATVIAISRRATSMKSAERLGARHAIGFTSNEDAVAEVERLTGGDLCDRVVEATGHQEPLDLATRLTRTRGRLVIAGFHQSGARSVDMRLWNSRGIDVVSAHERAPEVLMQGMRDALEALTDGKLDIRPLLTHAFPLGDINDAFRTLRERPDGFVKAVVCP